MSDNQVVFPFGVMKIFYNEGLVMVIQHMKKLQINELYTFTVKFMVHEQHVNKQFSLNKTKQHCN